MNTQNIIFFCFIKYDMVIAVEALLFITLESTTQQDDLRNFDSLPSLCPVLLQRHVQSGQLKQMLLRRLKWGAVARGSTLAWVNL